MKQIMTNQKGAIAIITALLLTTFLGLAALGIDTGYMVASKNELQNAADAGALAGAWQLSNDGDGNAIKQTAMDTVGENKASNGNISLNPENIKIGKWNFNSKKFFESSLNDLNDLEDYEKKAVEVTIQNHNVNLFFRSNNEPLGAQAVAAGGSGDGDLIPLAVDTEFVESDIDKIFTIWGDNLSPGNWGTVNLDKDANGAAGASTIRDWLENGYSGSLDIGDNISRQTGQGAIVSNPDIVEERINDPARSIVVVPIVDEFHQGSGGKKNKSEVIGFAIMELWKIIYKNGNKAEKVTAKYLGPANPSGGGGGGSSSGGIKIVLVK